MDGVSFLRNRDVIESAIATEVILRIHQCLFGIPDPPHVPVVSYNLVIP